MDTLKVLALLAVTMLLLKRSIYGPQRSFAVLGLGCCVAGFLVLRGVVQPGDSMSWLGALLIGGGLCASIGMVLTDICWTVKRATANKTES
jgi:hypothetical protein